MKITMFRFIVPFAVTALLVASCTNSGQQFVYTGRIDVDTITVSSQASGVIDSLTVQEGDAVHKGDTLGRINTDRLQAQKKQQEAQLVGLDVRRSVARSQIEQAQVELKFARETLDKTEKVLTQGGATQQRRDELSIQVKVNQANLAALQSNYKLIAAQEDELRAGMDLTDITIRDAQIVSPIDGVVLDKFHYQGELAAVGTPLLSIADLSMLTVEIYIPLSKLGSVTIGKTATVTADGVEQSFRGTVTWISSQAGVYP